jgi:hypothetical protein
MPLPGHCPSNPRWAAVGNGSFSTFDLNESGNGACPGPLASPGSSRKRSPEEVTIDDLPPQPSEVNTTGVASTAKNTARGDRTIRIRSEFGPRLFHEIGHRLGLSRPLIAAGGAADEGRGKQGRGQAPHHDSTEDHPPNRSVGFHGPFLAECTIKLDARDGVSHNTVRQSRGIQAAGYMDELKRGRSGE